MYKEDDSVNGVSTHSRLKAAGSTSLAVGYRSLRFNTQPPKGGWICSAMSSINRIGFNTQPPKGGWMINHIKMILTNGFNTQPPKGGWLPKRVVGSRPAGFNTQPPKGGWLLLWPVSTVA